jgi:cellulose synthase/poly-beta-1,6-N-acetylglucosamine synthase-like glycosyltransferase
MCYITGTNVMLRARVCFEVCRFAQMNASANSDALESGIDTRQIYAEDEISEDIELGSRMQAAGYKSIFIGEKLATGEVRCRCLPLSPLCPCLLDSFHVCLR